MNKILTSVIAVTVSLGLSQVSYAKEHHGPSKPEASKHRAHSNNHANNNSRRRADQRHERRSEHRSNRAANHRHSDRDQHRRAVNQQRRHDRYDRRYDRRHDRHDRYRDHYRPRHNHRHYNRYYSYHDYPRYRQYPSSVYYLGQDWYYYGNSYHPFPRGHIHSRHCHHRYWEPLAAGIILGAVLGW